MNLAARTGHQVRGRRATPRASAQLGGQNPNRAIHDHSVVEILFKVEINDERAKANRFRVGGIPFERVRSCKGPAQLARARRLAANLKCRGQVCELVSHRCSVDGFLFIKIKLKTIQFFKLGADQIHIILHPGFKNAIRGFGPRRGIGEWAALARLGSWEQFDVVAIPNGRGIVTRNGNTFESKSFVTHADD